MRLIFLTCWFVLLSTLGLVSCRDSTSSARRQSGLDAFIPQYNKYISEWTEKQRLTEEKQLSLIQTQLQNAPSTTDKIRLENQIKDHKRNLAKWQYRLSIGDYLKQAKVSDIPKDLNWESGMDQPEIGDPRAIKGGAFRTFVPSFPPTIRPIGENSNNSFRGNLYDNIDMTLVGLHPQTMKIIPSIAKQWAISKDERTIYFKIHPHATYSNGEPITAKDYFMQIFVCCSDNINNPFAKQHFRENIAQICLYDEHTLSVSLPEAKVYSPFIAGSITPCSQSFYQDYGLDYTERYQWKFPPTTGAYEVKNEDIIKGVSITQSRVKNWWAKDLKYYRYRFNPDKIVTTVIRDESKSFELFRAGEIDTFLITRPDYWYEKSEIEPVYQGYIERHKFFTQFPIIPRGIYFNVIKPPLNDLNLRKGIQHALHWQKIIDTLFRGDYQRVNSFQEGYLLFSDPSIKAPLFSNEEARKYFRLAGYTEEGKDGILHKPDGTRLSISLTYPAQPAFDRMFSLLREEAKSCGLDFQLDGLESTVFYKKITQKQHQLTFASWLSTPPTPDFYQFVHSANAFDSKGNIKAQTNNIFSWSRPDTDALCEQARNARTNEELRDANVKLQHIIHDEAIFSPGYIAPYICIGSWRWVRWPDCPNTHFCPPVVYDPHDMHVLWIDDKMKQETLSARREKKPFPEVLNIVDAYKKSAEAKPENNDSK